MHCAVSGKHHSQTHSANSTQLTAILRLVTEPTPGSGVPSTCLSMSPEGGLSFRCRECYKEGFQPFKGATSISFWIKSAASADPFESSAPAGTVGTMSEAVNFGSSTAQKLEGMSLP